MAVGASASSPRVEPRTSSQRPDAVRTRAVALAPSSTCRPTMLRARLATAATTGGSAWPRVFSRRSASHISAEASACVIELSGATSARPADPEVSLAFGRQGGEQNRPPEPRGEMVGHGRDDLSVGGREVVPVGRSQQREAAPRRRLSGHNRPQLVPEPVRSLELAMPHAPVQFSVRRLAEARRAPARAPERAERVEVLTLDLDLRHALGRRSRKAVLNHLARRQERGRVHCEHAEAVETHLASQKLGRAARELAHVGAAVREPGEVTAEAF